MRWALAIVVACFVLALPVQAASPAASATTTIRLISIASGAGVVVDREPKGQPDVGDAFWVKSTLRNAVAQFGRPRNAVVGSDRATYTIKSETRIEVKVRVALPGGTLDAQANAGVASATKQVIRVTGGTGRFAGASGQAEVRNLNASGTRALNIYRLQLP
jgi:hypothetical protein